MTDTDLRQALNPPAPSAAARQGPVPWWGVILGFVAAAIVVGCGTTLIMSLLADTFTSWGGGWSELAVNAMLVTGMIGASAIPIFAVIRGLMAWTGKRFWVGFLLVWTIACFVPPLVTARSLEYFDVLVMLWLKVGAVPVLLGGTLQYLIERVLRRTP